MTRCARIRTTHDDATTAATVAAAVRPDNTDSMTTQVDEDAVVTTIERETTGGLHSTVDDYIVNVSVAERVARTARARGEPRESTDETRHESDDSRADDERTTDDTQTIHREHTNYE